MLICSYTSYFLLTIPLAILKLVLRPSISRFALRSRYPLNRTYSFMLSLFFLSSLVVMLFAVISGCLTLDCNWTAIWQTLRSSLESLFACVDAVTSASMQSVRLVPSLLDFRVDGRPTSVQRESI